jgi:hypothetical protein
VQEYFIFWDLGVLGLLEFLLVNGRIESRTFLSSDIREFSVKLHTDIGYCIVVHTSSQNARLLSCDPVACDPRVLWKYCAF